LEFWVSYWGFWHFYYELLFFEYIKHHSKFDVSQRLKFLIMKNKSFYFSIILSLFALNVFSQKSDSIEMIHGPERYKKEVVDICKSYSKMDSPQNDRIQKYKGFDGGITGYLMSEEDKEIEIIINRFLKIDRISSSYIQTDKSGTQYGFKYYRTVKDHDGIERSIKGVVIWIEN
jgi:hypothetical protein